MKFHTLTLSMSLALSMAGCAAGEEEGEQPVPGPTAGEAAGGPCLGDTICGEDWQPAFDRTYRVRASSVWVQSSKQLQLCDRDPGCAFESDMAVYFSELADPILAAASLYTSPAQIVVTRDSYLVIDLGEVSCIVDLTAEQLTAGSAHCVGPTRSLALDIDAL